MKFYLSNLFFQTMCCLLRPDEGLSHRSPQDPQHVQAWRTYMYLIIPLDFWKVFGNIVSLFLQLWIFFPKLFRCM